MRGRSTGLLSRLGSRCLWLGGVGIPGGGAGHGGDLDAALARYGSERQRFGDWIVGRGRDLGASIGMRAGAGARLDRDELDRRAAAAVSAYAANADELSRLAADGSIPGSV